MSCLLRQLQWSLPQGSVFGPIIFNCVMSDLPKLLWDMSIGYHTYVDDTQCWVRYNKSGEFNNEESIRRRMKQALGLISKFMNDNHLKLNPKKTQFIPFCRKTKSFIPKEQFLILIHAFITSQLDFCDSFFYRLTNNLITRTQTVQNSCHVFNERSMPTQLTLALIFTGFQSELVLA